MNVWVRGTSHLLLYPDNVNLEKIEDDKERTQIEAIINNFGQTPTQLFSEPHPQRISPQEARRTLGKGKRSNCRLFDHLEHITTHSVDVSHLMM